ncbi:hypothetical protein GALMADRAFT_146649 [Galerina marginata CBS 339.88]|uniref:Uncharacterized protein n=1 Tax=Galerina marginata (strain CBS 339.88) TaxID=685588 RepID=A0A067SBC1_GALM3|nr:hypothetical protein GALMADRAFT_146649 [Galerina marginata CBS 339.88]
MRTCLLPILLLIAPFAFSKALGVPRDLDSGNVVIESRQDVNIISIQAPDPFKAISEYLQNEENNKIAQSKVEVKANNPSQTGIELLRGALNDIQADNGRKHNGYSVMAVRTFKAQVPAWDGLPGPDWGHTFMTMNGSDGPTTWDYYYYRTGHITVDTTDFAHDVVIVGNALVDHNAQSPTLYTISLPLAVNNRL